MVRTIRFACTEHIHVFHLLQISGHRISTAPCPVIFMIRGLNHWSHYLTVMWIRITVIEVAIMVQPHSEIHRLNYRFVSTEVDRLINVFLKHECIRKTPFELCLTHEPFHAPVQMRMIFRRLC